MANQPEPQPDPPPDDILQKIIEKMEAMHRAVEKMDETIDDWLAQLRTLASLWKADAKHTALLTPAIQQTLTFVRTKDLLAAEAARGATKVEPVPLPRRKTKFVIDGLRSITLPQKPSLLLLILISSETDSKHLNRKDNTDEYVPWKSRKEIQRRMKKKTGKKLKSGALNNLVHRLRDLMTAQALHPDFIQRDRRRGLRFAVRRDPPGAPPPDTASGI